MRGRRGRAWSLHLPDFELVKDAAELGGVVRAATAARPVEKVACDVRVGSGTG
jgi:hypothetical protein